ncbi:hypothetical protein [Aliikangiella sp. IMCC44359]|uniref:hypothetical protein n=1 Tax=Aliikangiella sp. IMCC44359 TaxID=3459125 RepID=UPI00403AF5AE
MTKYTREVEQQLKPLKELSAEWHLQNNSDCTQYSLQKLLTSILTSDRLPEIFSILSKVITQPTSQLDNMVVRCQAAKQLTESLGFNTNPQHTPCVFGSLLNNRIEANYECLTSFRSIKYYPIALIEAMKEMNIEVTIESHILRNPLEYTLWELTNLSIDHILLLRKLIFKKIKLKLGNDILDNYVKLVEKNRLETMGTAGFFAEHWKLHQPVVLVSSSAYSFWSKAMRQFGFGSASLIKVATDKNVKIDLNELERILVKLHLQNIPVLAVIGTLGTSEFGSIDPIHSIIKLQQQFSQQGLNFYTHIDASNATYFTTLFKDENNQPLTYELLKKDYTYFPSRNVYQSFQSLNLTDSITAALPSQDNYLPGAGCFILNNRNAMKILNSSAYNSTNQINEPNKHPINNDFISDSCSERCPTEAYLNHKYKPLNTNKFKKSAKQWLVATEYFYKKITRLKDKLNQLVNIYLPFKPETNVLVMIINPVNNHSLSQMNDFLKRIQNTLSGYTKSSLYVDLFNSTIAPLDIHDLAQSEKVNFFNNLQFTTQDTGNTTNQKILLLKYTFASPYFLTKKENIKSLDIYCDFLENAIKERLNFDS